EWFREIESRCSRFDPQSELIQLSHRIGESVPVSAILFEAVRFALAVAENSGGAFDPTVGYIMESRGFNREYQTGATIQSNIRSQGSVSFRDVLVDEEQRSITLLRPLVLDLGAVAKGLAIDMAARELQKFRNFAIDAGGDLYLGGHNSAGESWSVGIRHPRNDDTLLECIRVSHFAGCTSRDYQRDRHILDSPVGTPVTEVA